MVLLGNDLSLAAIIVVNLKLEHIHDIKIINVLNCISNVYGELDLVKYHTITNHFICKELYYATIANHKIMR